jgi:hypothetical protein
MTNPSCESCGGRGWTNQVTGSDRYFTTIFEPKAMQLCDDVYPSHDRVPPELRGQPCTPRTNFRPHQRLAYGGRVIDDDRMRGGMRLRSEKAVETRRLNAAAKAAEAARDGGGHKPSRSGPRG